MILVFTASSGKYNKSTHRFSYFYKQTWSLNDEFRCQSGCEGLTHLPNPAKDLAAPVACFSNKKAVFVSVCAAQPSMFLAAAAVWRAAAGAGGGGPFLKCWWAYWKCVRQERNAGRGWESVWVWDVLNPLLFMCAHVQCVCLNMPMCVLTLLQPIIPASIVSNPKPTGVSHSVSANKVVLKLWVWCWNGYSLYKDKHSYEFWK